MYVPSQPLMRPLLSQFLSIEHEPHPSFAPVRPRAQWRRTRQAVHLLEVTRPIYCNGCVNVGMDTL
jgi:hypothetical protein